VSNVLVTAEALADSASATLGGPECHLAADGPYAEAKEQLAGFIIIDWDFRKRAEVIGAQWPCPRGVVELPLVMWPGGEDQ
jgi:hypothetical protein